MQQNTVQRAQWLVFYKMLFADCRLDYPGIGPEHSYLSDIGRAEYFAVTDAEALEAFQMVSRLEGIIPALETSHAFAYLKVTYLKMSLCTHVNCTAGHRIACQDCVVQQL